MSTNSGAVQGAGCFCGVRPGGFEPLAFGVGVMIWAFRRFWGYLVNRHGHWIFSCFNFYLMVSFWDLLESS